MHVSVLIGRSVAVVDVHYTPLLLWSMCITLRMHVSVLIGRSVAVVDVHYTPHACVCTDR